MSARSTELGLLRPLHGAGPAQTFLALHPDTNTLPYITRNLTLIPTLNLTLAPTPTLYPLPKLLPPILAGKRAVRDSSPTVVSLESTHRRSVCVYSKVSRTVLPMRLEGANRSPWELDFAHEGHIHGAN